MQKKTHIPSGFEAIDAHTGGGYLPGTLFIARIMEVYPDELQSFIIDQIREFTINGKRVFVASLEMNERDLAKCLLMDATPQQIRKLFDAELCVCVKRENTSFKRTIKEFEEYLDRIAPDVFLIDGIDEILPPVERQMPPETSAVDALLKLAKDASVPVIVSDYRNRLDTGLHRDARVTEMVLKTDIRDTVQASILSNDKETVTEDLYGLWRVFEKILKKEQN